MAEDWQSQSFRQNIIQKMNEMMQNSPVDPSKNATVMEGHVFKKARTREEYVNMITKLIKHMSYTPNKAQPQPQEMGGGNMMQDPINALQNLASQGTRNPQMMANQNSQISPGSVMGGGNVPASNLLQTLTQRPGQQMQNMQGIRGQMAVGPMGGNMLQTGIGPNTMGNQMANQMGSMNPTMNMQMNQMGNQPNQMGGNMPGQMNQLPMNQMPMNPGMQGQGPITAMNNVNTIPMNQMNPNQINIGVNHSQLNQIMNRMNPNQAVNNVPNQAPQGGMPNQMTAVGAMNPQAQLPQPGVNPGVQVSMGQNAGQMNPAVNTSGTMFPNNRNVGQSHFPRQSPSPTVQSPAGMGQQHQNPQMIASPALVPSSSPQMSNIMVNNQRTALRQSPNAPLNTPGQVTGSSPFNAQEDQMYREKYKQLTKYIEPLKRMVAKIGNDDTEKIMKMNKLLEILCNPHQRIPLETLLKCEKALEMMDFKSCLMSSNQFASSNPLFEALSATLQNPYKNHTLQRTFRPCLEALFGTDIKSVPPPPKRRQRIAQEDTASLEIPHVLQGEIARLDQKFKVSLDSASQNNNKTIKLVCCLDDKRLPCVPPVSVSIPEEYPMASPNCSLSEQEYLATPFLTAVQNAFIARVSKLPKCYSLSHLLDTWEMSVRQACSPYSVTPTNFTALLGV